MNRKAGKTPDASRTPRWVGTNWRRPTARIRRNGIGRAISRKVKATGIARIEAGKTLAEALKRLLEGKEARLTFKGRDAIRIFGLVDKSCTVMDAVADTMGDFRKCLNGIEFALSRKGKPITKDDAAELVRQVEAEREERKANMVCVTPDTVIACPQCGFFPIRVGKALSDVK